MKFEDAMLRGSWQRLGYKNTHTIETSVFVISPSVNFESNKVIVD